MSSLPSFRIPQAMRIDRYLPRFLMRERLPSHMKSFDEQHEKTPVIARTLRYDCPFRSGQLLRPLDRERVVPQGWWWRHSDTEGDIRV